MRFGKFPKRYILAILGQLGLLVAFSMRTNLNIGLAAMVNSTYVQERAHHPRNPECPIKESNVTSESKSGVFDWDEKLQGFVLAAFYYGYVVTPLPGGLLATRFGGKWVFGIGIFSTALLSIVTPIAAKTSVNLLIVIRAVAGLFEGVAFPGMHQLLGKWSPIYERSRLASFVYTGAPLGTMITYLTSGFLCNSGFLGGWPSLFYIYGCIGVVWFVLWSLFTASSPEEHGAISSAELENIMTLRGGCTGKAMRCPWKQMFTSKAVWALLISNICISWFFYTCLSCLPSYYKEVLGFSIKEDGLVSALPYLLSFCIAILSGQAADLLRRRNYLSANSVRKMFSSIVFFSSAILLVAVGYTGCSPVAAVCILTMANGFLGFCNAGPCINHIDVAPNFAGILLGITDTWGTVAGILAPILVGFLTENEPTRKQWQKVFFVSSAISVMGGFAFLLLGSGEEQPWNSRPRKINQYCDGKDDKEAKNLI